MTQMWDERLISRQRAYAVAGEWPVFFHQDGGGRRFWRCHQCAQSAMEIHQLAPVTIDGLVGAVVRHAVTAHNVNLSGSGDGRGPDTDRAAAGDAGRGHFGGGAGAAGDRYGDQEGRGGGVPGVAGGGDR